MSDRSPPDRRDPRDPAADRAASDPSEPADSARADAPAPAPGSATAGVAAEPAATGGALPRPEAVGSQGAATAPTGSGTVSPGAAIAGPTAANTTIPGAPHAGAANPAQATPDARSAAGAGPGDPGIPPRSGGGGARSGAAGGGRPAGEPGRRDPATPPGRNRPAERPPTRRDPLGALALALAVIEGVALAVAWMHPRVPPALARDVAAARSRADDASKRADTAVADATDARSAVDALGSHPAGAAPSADHALAARLGALEARVDALPTAPAAGASAPATAPPAPPPPPDQSAAIAALSSKLDAAVATFDASVAAVREETRRTAATLADAERADTASLRADAARTEAASNDRFAGLASRLAQESAASRGVAALAGRADRLARLQAAGVALGAGRPVGSLDDAPPALARFASTAPPTVAALVLAFPAASRATLKASEPSTRHLNFFRRLWVRAQAAVTVSDGDRVVVGDPAAGIVATARGRLEAGDLRGAVSTLAALQGAAASTMAPWLDRARSLLDAQDALARLETAT